MCKLKMTYQIFRKIVSKEEYFASWDSDNYNKLTEALKDRIYNKYCIKAEVFQRDKFKCANIECLYPDSPLTLHHVKFQKNGGKDSGRNCVTLCKTCHQGYHRGKRSFTLSDTDVMPSHMRGHTFKLSVDESINWKKVKAEMKKLRKTLISERVYLSMEDLALLMKFFDMVVDYESDDD